MTACTVLNPVLVDSLLDQFKRQAPALPMVGGRIDWDALDRRDVANATQVKAPYYQAALELYDTAAERMPAFQERCRARHAVANYLRTVVAPWALERGLGLAARDYDNMAEKLEDARPWATWGYDESDGALVFDWAQRAGLVKLCPDDARDEGTRLGAKYTWRVEELQEMGYDVQYWVLTWPNVPRGHLRSAIDGMQKAFRNRIMYARADGTTGRQSIDDPKRRFPELQGALTTLETPLSGRGDWNVHLNAIVVFKGARPDWSAYRDAWGARIDMQRVPSGAAGSAMRELCKYLVKVVANTAPEDRKPKRDRRTGELLPPAPPLIEWPADDFDEWHRAHKGVRRTRSVGALNANARSKWGAFWKWCEKLDGRKVTRDPNDYQPLGKVTMTPTRYSIDRPMPDTRALDRRQLHLIPGNIFDGSEPDPRGTGPPVLALWAGDNDQERRS